MLKVYLCLYNDSKMRKNGGSIPVNKFGDDLDEGISIEAFSLDHLPDHGEWHQPERHDRHSFFLLEKGKVTIEIDFQIFEIQAPSIIHMHPDQVHRIISVEKLYTCAWAADNDNLNSNYLKLLDYITPAAPILLDEDQRALLSDTTKLCLKFASRNEDQLYPSLLKDNINLLVGLVISIYLDSVKPADKMSRSEFVTKSFREVLANHFALLKRPAAYAEKLNLSTPYLNECVKNTTGKPVSYHIQQRVILEAKRLLYHSDLSLKEIASKLGYDDYPYFSRLFSKVAGKSPLAFRYKNLD